ncbi:hypothetical protein GOBAR_DD36819 [Gossypium barbadense]|nr:hypothetical protein GOBAR_DD36819 [Gossypium barbadense]
MKTLTSPCSKPIFGNNRDRGFSSFQHLSLTRAQGELETAETQPKEHNPSKTTRAKFQLKKECSFGEHFFIVGDHPMLGSWDPESCIPLTWSEGHVWAVELDIPVGISVQFKFILKTTTGDILWQPGHDRIFKSLETENMIVVSEDWEAADYQEVLKEELQALSEELATGNGVPSLDKPFAIVAKNPSYPTEDFMANKNAEALGMNRTKYANNEAMAIANKNVVVAEDLTPLSTVATEEEMLDADDKNSTSDTSVGVDEAKCDELSEVNHGNKKTTAVTYNGLEQLDKLYIQLAREQPGPGPFQHNNVLQSDIQWDHQTLQKLLDSFKISITHPVAMRQLPNDED